MGARVLVAGASGFAGALAARLVQRHPWLELGPVTSRSDVGTRLDALYPRHRVGAVLEELDLDRHAAEVDAAIVAYPHGAAAPVVAALREQGVKVIDLSADFRLRDVATYEHWYGVQHPAPELIAQAAYGLPERHRDAIGDASLVACPGCFPTAAILALAPLSGRIADAIVDAKTGVSGAGRAATARTHFVSVDENVVAYGVGHHRHMPEIDQEVGAARPITFTPHLLPLDQGELVSCYVDLTEPVGDLRALYEEAYGGEPFIELVDRPPGVRDVR
ncbi:MAG TPA: N-acetyl-gamma-glutamyl-phosphate reductase, partial [Baekduia sp.]|nr:N-acetyl-gamma-glutamyl-phosphate reductase [Baekduia sp.]